MANEAWVGGSFQNVLGVACGDPVCTDRGVDLLAARSESEAATQRLQVLRSVLLLPSSGAELGFVPDRRPAPSCRPSSVIHILTR